MKKSLHVCYFYCSSMVITLHVELINSIFISNKYSSTIHPLLKGPDRNVHFSQGANMKKS
jgi:hypothetical protein